LDANDEDQVIKKEKIAAPEKTSGKNFIHQHQGYRPSLVVVSSPPPVFTAPSLQLRRRSQRRRRRRSRRIQERVTEAVGETTTGESTESHRSHGFRQHTNLFARPWIMG